MTTPRAVPCRYLRMRPMALTNSVSTEQKPLSAALCENQTSLYHSKVLLDDYDAGKWLELETCRSCPQYQAVRR